MQKDFPKKGLLVQINGEPNYLTITYENIIRALHRVFYGTEMPEEEVQKMVREHEQKQLTDKD